MSWIMLQISSIFIDSASSILDKKLVRDHEPRPVIYLISFAVVGLPLTIAGVLFLPWPGIEAAGIGLLVGFIFAVMVLLYYKAMNLEEVSRLIPVLRLSSVLNLAFLAMFLDDQLSVLQYTASGLMMLGAVMLSRKPNRPSSEKRVQLSRGVALMSVVAVLSAVHGLFGSHLVLTYSPWVLIVWSNTGIVISMGLLLLSPAQRDEIRHGLATAPYRLRVIVLGEQTGRLITSVLSDFAILEAGSAAITTALGGLRPFIVLVLAFVFLGERINCKESWSKLSGIGLISIGAGLLLVA